MDEFAIVILAAGAATRMGRPKQLLEVAGVPLVRRAAQTALDSKCGPVIVVSGAYPLEKALAGLAVTIADNQHWEVGMGSSILRGLKELVGREVAGVILSLADQPLLEPSTYQKYVARQKGSGLPIVASSYSGTLGVPMLVKNEYLDQLWTLPPAQGCKGFIERNGMVVATLDCPEAATDIDTPADYQQFKSQCYIA